MCIIHTAQTVSHFTMITSLWSLEAGRMDFSLNKTKPSFYAGCTRAASGEPLLTQQGRLSAEDCKHCFQAQTVKKKKQQNNTQLLTLNGVPVTGQRPNFKFNASLHSKSPSTTPSSILLLSFFFFFPSFSTKFFLNPLYVLKIFERSQHFLRSHCYGKFSFGWKAFRPKFHIWLEHPTADWLNHRNQQTPQWLISREKQSSYVVD